MDTGVDTELARPRKWILARLSHQRLSLARSWPVPATSRADQRMKAVQVGNTENAGSLGKEATLAEALALVTAASRKLTAPFQLTDLVTG